MKLFKLIKLGHKNITHHKKQTAMTVIIVGTLFSLLMALQFVVQGVENIFINREEQIFSNKTYIQARNSNYDYHRNIANKIDIECEEEIKKQNQDKKEYNIEDQKLFECKERKNAETNFWKKDQNINKIKQKFNKRAKKFGGKVTSEVKYVKKDGIIYAFYSSKMFENIIKADLLTTPKDSIPALVSVHDAFDLLNIKTRAGASDKEIRQNINRTKKEIIGKVFEKNNQKIYVVGIIPYGKNYPTLSKYRNDIKIIDIVLGQISGYKEISSYIYINDGSKNVKNFFKKAKHEHYEIIIGFNDYHQAYNYYKYETGKKDPIIFADTGDYFAIKHPVSEIITNRINHIYNMKVFKNALSIINYVLLFIAVIIIIFTFLKIINQDNKLMALYRSLGATGADVFVIYLWHLVELCILVIIYALIIANLMAVIVSFYYQTDINTSVALFYGENINKRYWLIGFNKELMSVILIILLSAPIVSLLTIDQLSMKNIAKRLKKQ